MAPVTFTLTYWLHATVNEEAWILVSETVSQLFSDWQGLKPETLPCLKKNWLNFLNPLENELLYFLLNSLLFYVPETNETNCLN